ncbi:putrescine aminotransferase [Sporolactobacillus sp. THM7-7]|nr:putrescine aminotransferase [Sporolactobacillus sp. THM7-7]
MSELKKETLIDDLEQVIGYIKNSRNLSKEDKEKITNETIEYTKTNLNPGWLDYRKSVSENYAIVEWADGGDAFYDLYGQKYMDFLGGYGIFTAGHRNPEILNPILKQLDRQPMNSQELLEPLRGYLAKIMAEITPGNLHNIFFTSGGAEAVEMALKLAKLASGKQWFISAVNAFHGKSFGALSVTGKNMYRAPYLPLLQQVQHVEYGNAEAMETAIKNLIAVGESVAAVILEPIQGEAGVMIPPEGYLKKVREICDQYGILLILDEIQTGMGRTGTMWRCEAEDVVPDIMCFGKSFGGGLCPATGIMFKEALLVNEMAEDPCLLGSPTFAGNPLSSVASLATIRYMLKNDIPGMCKRKGAIILSKLKNLQKKYPEILIDFRGAGLLIAMEFENSDIGYFVAKHLFSKKILTAGTLNNAKTIRIEPPAVISEEAIDVLGQELDNVFEQVRAEFIEKKEAIK